MAWHYITNKHTKDVEIVASLDGYDLDQWQVLAVKSNRAPTEFQKVGKDGSLSTDTAAKAKSQKRQPLALMTQAELLDLILKMQADIEALKAR